ncbi:MAG: LysR family transcriptional regulator [Lachnospiraceae bacterium]|jgi:DNA-binding transcriptional LysR family regulator|nr:LysR family transcriptional regulator [Lachnospiraceae bacterium]
MNSTQLRCFLTSANTLSFTEAADQLYLTQQAVSRNIINLERELGAVLFVRDTRSLRLTDAGAYYRSYFTNADYDFHSVCTEVEDMYSRLAERFRIGYSRWIDPLGQIDEGVASFRAGHPGTHFSGRQYHNDTLFSELSKGELDVVLMSEAQISWIREFERAPIAHEDICFYAPPYVEGDTPDPNLWGLPILLNAAWDWTYFEWRQMVLKEMDHLDVTSDRVVSLPNIQSIYAELTLGDCVVIIDDRFGNVSGFKNMRRFHIDSSTRVFALWDRQNETPLIGDFVKHLQGAFGYNAAKPTA